MVYDNAMQWTVSFVIELLYFAGLGNRRLRQILGYLLMTVVIGSTVIMAAGAAVPFALGIMVLLPFRLLNIARAIKSRMHPLYLRKATLRTSLSIIGLHIAAYILTLPPLLRYFGYLPQIQLFTAATILALASWHIYKTRHISNAAHFSDHELPTVSVCIPARNETDALEQCLRSVLANDYPKLEIVVLDDCSHERTAEIIKSFAHDGVRFVQGEEPAQRWLAKNQAYHKLLSEANGELVLFCGVDVRFGPRAIRSLVATMLNRKKIMISVVPLRFYSKLNEAFVQPMRYWWELVPPRKLFNRPPVLSTCWLANRKSMLKAGGFKAVSHSIIPEGYFARRFIKNNGYAFIRADKELDVRTTKPLREQWDTAIRTNYPQIRRRPEMAIILTVFTLSVLVMPFVQLPIALLSGNMGFFITSALTCVFLIAAHAQIVKVTDPANLPLALINLPIASLIEVVIGYSSMLRYEFGSVEWKDRNVCIPVMHTIPKKDFLASGSIK